MCAMYVKIRRHQHTRVYAHTGPRHYIYCTTTTTTIYISLSPSASRAPLSPIPVPATYYNMHVHIKPHNTNPHTYQTCTHKSRVTAKPQLQCLYVSSPHSSVPQALLPAAPSPHTLRRGGREAVASVRLDCAQCNLDGGRAVALLRVHGAAREVGRGDAERRHQLRRAVARHRVGQRVGDARHQLVRTRVGLGYAAL